MLVQVGQRFSLSSPSLGAVHQSLELTNRVIWLAGELQGATCSSLPVSLQLGSQHLRLPVYVLELTLFKAVTLPTELSPASRLLRGDYCVGSTFVARINDLNINVSNGVCPDLLSFSAFCLVKKKSPNRDPYPALDLQPLEW